VPWSVLQTFSGASDGNYDEGAPPKELPLALRHLAWQGFEFFNPRCWSKTYRSGAKIIRKTQVFRDYVFVQVGDRWRAINSTTGVVGLIMSEPEKPATVADQFIQALMGRRDDDGIVKLDGSRFKIGEAVRLRSGSSWELGIYDGQRDRERSYVLMKWLGAERRVEVREDNLVAA
jgi:transcription antitermination factor NusG